MTRARSRMALKDFVPFLLSARFLLVERVKIPLNSISLIFQVTPENDWLSDRWLSAYILELIGLTAAEASNPQKSLPQATKQVFWRIPFFYVVSLFIVGLLVPCTNENLLNSGANSKYSPFVIAVRLARVKALPSIFNAKWESRERVSWPLTRLGRRGWRKLFLKSSLLMSRFWNGNYHCITYKRCKPLRIWFNANRR